MKSDHIILTSQSVHEAQNIHKILVKSGYTLHHLTSGIFYHDVIGCHPQ